AFVVRHGAGAARELEAAFDAAGLSGDLAALARAYLAAKGAPRAEARRIEAWLGGVNLVRSEESALALEPLSARTAKRTLVELSRIVTALGWRGMVLLVRDGEVLASLPPARRQAAYTVLRELIDNADGGRGLASCMILIAGSRSLLTGPRSLASLRPLA